MGQKLEFNRKKSGMFSAETDIFLSIYQTRRVTSWIPVLICLKIEQPMREKITSLPQIQNGFTSWVTLHNPSHLFATIFRPTLSDAKIFIFATLPNGKQIVFRATFVRK